MTMMVMEKLLPFLAAVFRSAIVRIMLIMMTMAMVLMMITSKDKLPLLRGVFVSANVLRKKKATVVLLNQDSHPDALSKFDFGDFHLDALPAGD